MVRYIILVTMNDKFNHKFEKVQLDQILQVLNDSFEILDDVERHRISYAIFNAKLHEGVFITDHVLYMIE